MKTRKSMLNARLQLGILVAAVMFLASVLAVAQTETVLHRFGIGSDGAGAYGRLTLDRAGNLYGTTVFGGASGAGIVFELVRGQGASETVLYNFTGGTDGSQPYGGVIFDAAGNLYGTTFLGGAFGQGTVYQLTPPATEGGAWTQTVLYSFTGGSDGSLPQSDLIFDAAGNLYGTTSNGSPFGGGIVFELTAPTSGGAWTETILHRFTNSEGVSPRAAVIFDNRGQLYGTLANGGAYSAGAVFRLRPPATAGGHWTERTLYVFTGAADGFGPLSRLIFFQGALYGTAVAGGASGVGVVFQLTPPSDPSDPWIETVIHDFTCGSDGCYPWAGLTLDKSGVLYGTTQFGGLPSNGGTVFHLTPPTQGGSWTENVLYSFLAEPGQLAAGGVIVDKSGAIYGTTIGANMTSGTAFRLVP